MVIKMNRKHKINLWLVFFVVALFVVSTGMSAMGNVVSNDVEKDNVSVNSVKAINVGTIEVGDNFVNVYSYDHKDHYAVDLGPNGRDLTIEADYDINVPGWCDNGYAYLGYWNKPTSEDSVHTGDKKSDKLSFTISNCKPGDRFELRVEGQYKDCLNEDITERAKSIVMIKILEPDLNVNDQDLMAKIKAGETGSISFNVQNIGDDGSLLDWGIKDEFGICAEDWSISRREGYDLEKGNPVTVTVTYTMPRLPIEQKYNNNKLTVYNKDNPSDHASVSITFKTPGYDKSKNLPLHFLQARFPLLQQLLQRLPAFQ